MRDRYGFPAADIALHYDTTCAFLVEPTAVVGANGIGFGGDGRLYVAQAFGGQISAMTPGTRQVDIIAPANGAIIAPDDLAFDSRGNLFATEVMSARVSLREPGGGTRVIAGNVPVANGITVWYDRIFMSEFRPDGRILELFADGSTPRVICSGLLAPNALAVGPDAYIYFPLVPLGEVWRVTIAGGAPERVASGFNIPTAVKFDATGALVVVESGNGAITRVDVVSGVKSRISQVAYGIDNLAFDAGGALYVSHFTDGSIIRVNRDGAVETLLEGGMLGPFGLCSAAGNQLLVADGMSIAMIDQHGVRRPAMLLEHGFPGYVRAVATLPDGAMVFANSAGDIMRYDPYKKYSGEEAVALARGLEQIMGIAADRAGNIYICEAGPGHLLKLAGTVLTRLASGLSRPAGVVCAADGTVFFTESAAGTVCQLSGGEVRTICRGLGEPQGIALLGGQLVVVDRLQRNLVLIDPVSGQARVVAENLPVGSAGEIPVNTLPGIAGLMPGPLLPFADVCVLANNTICVSGDASGSVLVLTLARSAPGL